MESLSIRSIDPISLNWVLPALIKVLPKLRRIALPNSKSMGYFRVPVSENDIADPNEFFSKVGQIKEWDISVEDLTDAARFILMLPRSCTSLAVRLTNHHYFARGDDFFIDTLGEFEYLESLVLSHVSRGPGIHEDYISSYYGFEDTLTSLELSTPNDDLRPSSLDFACIFPNLRSLRLVSGGTISLEPMESPYIFHHLCNLEIRNHALQFTDLVLSCLELPAITTLTVDACSPMYNIAFPAEEVPRVLKSLRSHLERFRGTLRTLQLDLETRAYDKSFEGVATRTGPTLFTVHPPIGLDKSASLPSPSNMFKQLTLQEEEEDEPPYLTDVMLDDTQAMLRWMSQRAEKMREVNDRSGAAEMWDSLREMLQFRKWVEG